MARFREKDHFTVAFYKVEIDLIFRATIWILSKKLCITAVLVIDQNQINYFIIKTILKNRFFKNVFDSHTRNTNLKRACSGTSFFPFPRPRKKGKVRASVSK